MEKNAILPLQFDIQRLKSFAFRGLFLRDSHYRLVVRACHLDYLPSLLDPALQAVLYVSLTQRQDSASE